MGMADSLHLTGITTKASLDRTSETDMGSNHGDYLARKQDSRCIGESSK